MRGDYQNMGVDDGKIKHNPDSENLKSLLKKPGKKDRKSNRVVFNENKNEFFDADYIILIREECEYDDEDDDSVCTCNQHEMVRLTCCEPNCNCNLYDDYEQMPQSPKFAPPLEFFDAVTLSPPEEYKDMELGEQERLTLRQTTRRKQRIAVCSECSANQDERKGAPLESFTENSTKNDVDTEEDKEKMDQSQQTTPTTSPLDSETDTQHYILETITMTSIKEQNILRKVENEVNISGSNLPSGGSSTTGILKGGRLWKNQENNSVKPNENSKIVETAASSDDESSNRRAVRFEESKENLVSEDRSSEESNLEIKENENYLKDTDDIKSNEICNNFPAPETTEMMLTFKLGNHVLISNNSLKPNSAVRQLFPYTKPTTGSTPVDKGTLDQYLITTESLRAFEDAKCSKLPQVIQSGDSNESFKRAIERNTLRRSLIRIEPKNKRNTQKTENSLVERIKQLTCDIDNTKEDSDEVSNQICQTEDAARNCLEENPIPNDFPEKSFSPSSSSTTSSNSSSASSTYKKITDLFGKREKTPDMQNDINELKPIQSLPDIGGPHNQYISNPNDTKVNTANESRKQFLSTLVPLTACVSNVGSLDEQHYQHINNDVGDRSSIASSVYKEYTLEDIDEGLIIRNEESRYIAPDVLAGTPVASDSGDELSMFVQQDASRIERIKKKYLPDQPENKDEDDENDDYGFNKRPSVQGIKPQFGSSTEILQQIQTQLQLPFSKTRVAWPYYSESGLTGLDNCNKRNLNQNVSNFHYIKVPEDMKERDASLQYHSTAVQEDIQYRNCTNQRCFRDICRSNLDPHSSPVGVEADFYDYQSLPRTKYGRPLSPPPQDMSKKYHQTMVYIPYNHLEGYQPVPSKPYYQSTNEVFRESNQNQINQRYIEPIYQQRAHYVESHHCNPNMVPLPTHKVNKPFFVNSSQPPLSSSNRSESPLLGQFSTARSTQTSATSLSVCNYYQGNLKYRTVGSFWKNGGNYITKFNRHSFPFMKSRDHTAEHVDHIALDESDSQYNGEMPNGLKHSTNKNTYLPPKYSTLSSPTKSRMFEREITEDSGNMSGLESDTNIHNTNATVISSTRQSYAPNSNSKPLFYAMNV